MPIKGQVIYVWEKGTTQMSNLYPHTVLNPQDQWGHRIRNPTKVYFELPSSRRYEVDALAKGLS